MVSAMLPPVNEPSGHPNKLFRPVVLLAAFVPLLTALPQVSGSEGPGVDAGYETDAVMRQLNSAFGAGVRPEDNAVVVLHQILGPHPEGATLSDEFYQELGIPRPSEDGHYYARLEYPDYAQRDQWRKTADSLNEAMERPWADADYPQIAAWIDKNEEPLAKLHDLVARPHWYSPLIPERDETGRRLGLVYVLLPAAQQTRDLARCLTCRAMRKLHAGDHEGAINDIVLTQHLGLRAAAGPTLIHHLVGVAIHAIGCHAGLKVAERIDSPALLKELREKTAALPVLPEVHKAVEVCERAMVQDCVRIIADGRIKSLSDVGFPQSSDATPEIMIRLGTLFVNWDIAEQTTLQLFDRQASTLKYSDFAQRAEEAKAAADELHALTRSSMPSRLLNGLLSSGSLTDACGTIAGQQIAALLLPAMHQVDNAHQRSLQYCENQQASLALLEYKARHGQFPASLSALSWTPQDTFNGQELNYQRTEKGFRLWSVGQNLINEDGRSWGTQPPEERGDDVIQEIPVPEEESA